LDSLVRRSWSSELEAREFPGGDDGAANGYEKRSIWADSKSIHTVSMIGEDSDRRTARGVKKVNGGTNSYCEIA
jgi:hypothetical protein